MGLFQSKSEFVTVLADQTVETGDEITLCCEVNREDVSVTWEKDGEKLRCVEGKHIVYTRNKKCTLQIKNAQSSDEGKYTVKIVQRDSETCSAFIRVEISQWREVTWNQNEMFARLKKFKICEKVPELRFLMFGPVGAGKSSSINTIKSVFEKRPFMGCLGAAASETSHTHIFEKVGVMDEEGCFPFAFYDVMGLQTEGGVLSEDIIKAINGNIKDRSQFNPTSSISESSRDYNKNPDIKDQIHCLVYVIPADTIAVMENEVITKIKAVRTKASNIGLPQVVFLTKIDCTCPITKKDLQKVYISKKIHNQIYRCSNIVGVPANCIFPVMNYHEQTDINENINCLIMDALTKIIDWANDYVKKKTE